MNRPTPTDFAIGSRAAVTACTGAAALSTLAWLGSHTVSWVLPALALLCCRACVRAKKRVAAWREWRDAWDEMAGAEQHAPPARSASARATAPDTAKEAQAVPQPKPQRVPRPLLVIGWIALLAWIAAHEGDGPTMGHGLVALCFVALTLWVASIACIGLSRWLLAPRSPSRPRAVVAAERASATDADGNPIVAQCLPVPTAVPERHVRELLPDYCRTLLASGKADIR